MKIPVLAYVAGFASLFPVLAALFRIRYLSSELRLLLVVFSVNALNTVLQLLLALQGVNNLFLAHFYLPFEFLSFLWVFTRWFRSSKPVLRSIALLFLLFWILSHLTLEKFDEPPYYTSLALHILSVGVVITFLHRMSASSKQSILKDSRFWLLSGLLTYASGEILFASLRSVIDRLPLDGLLVAYSAHWVILIVTNVFYAIGFLCKPPNSVGELELAR